MMGEDDLPIPEAGRVRAATRELIFLPAGIVAGLLVLGGALWAQPPHEPPIVVAKGGSSLAVPPYHVAKIPIDCSPHPCGGPGTATWEFSLDSPAQLSGTVRSDGPLDVWIGTAQGMEQACSLEEPPPACAPVVNGPAYLANVTGSGSYVDFGQLDLGFGGSANLLPAASWTILLINWGPSPVNVTVLSSIVATPI